MTDTSAGAISELARRLRSTVANQTLATWTRETLDEFMWSKQVEIGDAVLRHDHVAVKACHGPGKSHLASRLACWWLETHEPGTAMVVSTAPSTAQVGAILWRYIRQAHFRGNLRGYITGQNEWKLDHGELIGFGRKPPDHDIENTFQGIHAQYLLVILDEACHDAETDVLTDQGWRRFADLDGTERLLTMDASTHEAYYEKPVRLIAKRYAGPMHFYEAKGLNYAVTPDHSMLFGQYQVGAPLSWRVAPRDQIGTWNNKYTKKAIDWAVGDDPELSDDWLSFLGWFGSEGSINQRVTTVQVTQSSSRPDHAEIVALCERLGMRPKVYGDQVRVHDRVLALQLSGYGRTQLERRVPDCVRHASARQIGVYLDAYAKGDGYWHGNREIIYTSSDRMADDLQELILKTGMPSVVHRRKLAGTRSVFPDGHVGTSTVDGWVVTRPTRRSDAKMVNGNETVRQYDGMVYCATMPVDHLLFTRRRGYTMWSGNCGLVREMWNAAESLATGRDNRILAIGNPDNPRSVFRECFEPDSGWHTVTISAFDTPAFTGEDVPDDVLARLTSPSWVKARKAYWGEDSPLWQSKVLAEFPDIDSDPNILVPLYISVEATRRDPPDQIPMDWGPVSLTERFGRPVFGVDVSRFGDDHSVVWGRWGPAAKMLWRHTGKIETTELAGRVTRLARDLAPTTVFVDETGVGGGVVDQLRANGVPTTGVNAGTRARNHKEFVDVRAELYWAVREAFTENRIILEPPRDDNGVDELLGDLTEVKWGVTPKGHVVMQSKRGAERDVDVFGSKKPMPDSPDYLDALAFTYRKGVSSVVVGVGGARKG